MDEKLQFEEVYASYYKKVYNYVYSILMNRESTEDVVSDVFLKVYQHLHEYDGNRASLSTWLYRIAHNAAIDLVKSAASQKETAVEEFVGEMEPSTLDPERTCDDFNQLMDIDNQKVFLIMQQLTEEERSFLNLRYALELSNSEIAQRMDSNEKAISERYRRLLAKCKKILERS